MYAIEPKVFAGVLGPWSAGADPLNEQLADAIARAIERGDLTAGTRLPSERQLGAALGLSRTTIVGAYDRLRLAGLVRSRQGSGTRVAARAADQQGGVVAPGLLQPFLAAQSMPTGRRLALESFPAEVVVGDTIALTMGALGGSGLLRDVIRATLDADIARLTDDHGYVAYGLPAFRAAVAGLLTSRGLPTHADQVLVTSGAQQAVSLVADQLAGPDGVVAIENPVYMGAIDALRHVGARMVPVPVGPGGMRLDVLRQLVSGFAPSFVFVVPTYHNPTGAIMPEEQRRELARLAAERGIVVVEDLTPDHGAGRGVPPPIASFDRADLVVTIGSLSKVAWGGLRLGWIRGPRPVIARLAARKTVADYCTPTLTQAIGVHVVERIDEFADHATRVGRERRELAIETLRRRLPDWSVSEPLGGFSLWVRLPAGDASSFVRLALDHGVIVRPGPVASPDGGFRDHIRIAVGEEPDRLVEGIERLARAWGAYSPGSTRPEPAYTLSI